MSKLRIAEFVEYQLDIFRRECNFSDDELEFFNLRAKGKTYIEIEMSMSISHTKAIKLNKKVMSKMTRVIPILVKETRERENY